MALQRRTKQSEVKIDNLTEGEHEGRLVYVADLGMQEGQEYRGVKKKDAQQIALGIEILGSTVEIDGETKPRLLWTRPFNIFSSLTELGKELEYYKVFDATAEDGDIPDWDAQLLKPCSVVVKHVEGKGENKGNKYDNIHSLVAIPLKYQDSVPEATLTPGVGNSDEADNPVNAALFGLAKFVFDKRLNQEEDSSYGATPETEDDTPY